MERILTEKSRHNQVTDIEGHVTGTLTSRVREIPTSCQPSDLAEDPTNKRLPPGNTGGDRHHTGGPLSHPMSGQSEQIIVE